MNNKKEPDAVPSDIAAKVLFASDRTCCVCRKQGKPVQIHHLDDNPSNNNIRNLAVLCFDCHRETQIRGGFDRKLNADQIVFYREDWNRLVSMNRASCEFGDPEDIADHDCQIEMATSIAEIHRENKQYALLAIHYDIIGNAELRDKYVEIGIRADSSDSNVCFLRGLQGRPELIPKEVSERELSRYAKDKEWHERARLLRTLGRNLEAAKDYIRSIREDLAANRAFTAAIYLKEMVEEGLIEELFLVALSQAKADKDLWWQMRSLQELECYDEVRDFLLRNEDEINRTGDIMLAKQLAWAKGDTAGSIELMKQIACLDGSEPDDK